MSQSVAPVSTPRRIPRIALISSSILSPRERNVSDDRVRINPEGASSGRNGAPIAHLRVEESQNRNGRGLAGVPARAAVAVFAPARSTARPTHQGGRHRMPGDPALLPAGNAPDRDDGADHETSRFDNPRALRTTRARPKIGPPPSEADRSSERLSLPPARHRERRVPGTCRSITPSLSYAQNNRDLMGPMRRLMRVNRAKGCRQRMPSGRRAGVRDRREIPGRTKTK